MRYGNDIAASYLHKLTFDHQWDYAFVGHV
jgi:hypothetical protein